MRLSHNPPTLLSLLFTILSHTKTVQAIPLFNDFGLNFLQPRAGNCGADLQYICLASESCVTTANAAGALVAACTSGAQVAPLAGGYAVYTTTYTETNLLLRTSTFTTSWQAAATVGWIAPLTTGVASCLAEPLQHSCGAICCASNQKCQQLGSCVAIATSLWSIGDQPAPTVTSVPSGAAPVRPTSGALSTTTSTTKATTTVPFLAPATASGSTLPIISSSGGGGLSPGAIAGIVIGVILGILFLLLICFCCILKGALSGILGLFGLGKKKRRTTERTETIEHYSRHGSAAGASRRNTHTGWFGASKPTTVSEKRKEKSSGFGGLGAVGAGLAGLALVLGLKRKHDEKKANSRPAQSDIGSSYYTDSFTGTSASSASSDRRTRDSRRHR